MTGRQNGVYALPPRLTCERHWGRWRQNNTRIRGIPWAPREHLLRRADLSHREQQRSRKCIEKLLLRLIVRLVHCRQLHWFCEPPRRLLRICMKFPLVHKDATKVIDGMSYCNPNRFTEVPWLRYCGQLLRQVSLSLFFPYRDMRQRIKDVYIAWLENKQNSVDLAYFFSLCKLCFVTRMMAVRRAISTNVQRAWISSLYTNHC